MCPELRSLRRRKVSTETIYILCQRFLLRQKLRTGTVGCRIHNACPSTQKANHRGIIWTSQMTLRVPPNKSKVITMTQSRSLTNWPLQSARITSSSSRDFKTCLNLRFLRAPPSNCTKQALVSNTPNWLQLKEWHKRKRKLPRRSAWKSLCITLAALLWVQRGETNHLSSTACLYKITNRTRVDLKSITVVS